MHVSSRKCVQRVPDSTCHMTRFCYKAGLKASMCVKGLCMCKYGYELDTSSGYCKIGAAAMTLAGNYTEAETEEMLEFQREQDYATALNLAAFSAWMAAIASVSVVGMIALWRRISAAAPEEGSGYKAFLLTA